MNFLISNMKINYILLLLILITIIDCDDDTSCYSVSKPTSKGDCNGKLSKIEKESKYAYCCYVTYSKKADHNTCRAIDQTLYDNMSKYMKYIKKQKEASEIWREIYPNDKDDDYEDYGDVSIDCVSNYLKIGFMALTLLLI